MIRIYIITMKLAFKPFRINKIIILGLNKGLVMALKKITHSDKVGWGIIGSGGWADHTFAPAIKSARGGQLRAVLAPDMKEAISFCNRHNIKNAYSDINKFLADNSFEAVWIAAPNHMHKKFTVAALGAGKHVLCEKPMAITVDDCKAMINAGRKAKRVLQVAYNTRHHPKLQKLRQQWISGIYGRPVHGRAHIYYPYPEDLGYRSHGKAKGWHSFDKKVGGWAYADCATHGIDQLRWFLGDAEKVMASHNSNPSWGYRTPDHIVTMIAFKNGSVGSVSASTGLQPWRPRLEFYGDKGYIVIDGGIIGEPGSITTNIASGKERKIVLPPTKTYKLQIEAFSRAITHGEEYPLKPEDGLENVRLISQARGW